MGDQIGDRAELQVVALGERHQVGQARHGAVVVHDLADHRRRIQAGLAGDIDRRLGMAGADQRAAFARHQREHVAGRHDVVAAAFRVDRHSDGACAVVRGDAGGDALARLDRDGECGLVPRAVVRAHQRQAELLDALPGHRQADQAARVTRHEVDRIRRGELRRNDEIALVLPVLVIDQDEHAAVARFLDQLIGGGEVLRQLDGLQVLAFLELRQPRDVARQHVDLDVHRVAGRSEPKLVTEAVCGMMFTPKVSSATSLTVNDTPSTAMLPLTAMKRARAVGTRNTSASSRVPGRRTRLRRRHRHGRRPDGRPVHRRDAASVPG